MPGITAIEHIAAPCEVVFASATDIANLAGMYKAIKRVELLTPLPVGVGTRFRETREMFGREATEEMQITAFAPPHRFALQAENHGCRYHMQFRFEPCDGGTSVELDFSGEPLTLMAKIMSVLMRPMLRMMLKECQKDLDDLKQWAEAVVKSPAD